MPTLSEYITQTQQLIHDQSFQTISRTDMISYINRARSRTAQDAQCCRLLVSGQGPITTITVTNGGLGYTSPTIIITGGMGTGATATATIGLGGAITAITVTNPGSNYSPPLTVQITDATGVGATATAQQAANLLQTVVGQEVYTYASVNPLVAATPGYLRILDVFDIAVTWGGMKPAISQVTFGEIQAYYRSYAVPTLGQVYKWAKYGQGVNGSLYLWQIPSTAMAMDWDCICLPADLTGAVDEVDAVPDPFSDAVQYYAARLCYFNSQRYQDAGLMIEEYRMRMQEVRAATTNAQTRDWYDNSW